MSATPRPISPSARRAPGAPSVLMLVLVLMLGGCAATRPPSALAHGDTTRRLLATQRLDADAERREHAAAGMDGRSAAAAQQRYLKSFSDAQHDGAPIVGGK